MSGFVLSSNVGPCEEKVDKESIVGIGRKVRKLCKPRGLK